MVIPYFFYSKRLREERETNRKEGERLGNLYKDLPEVDYPMDGKDGNQGRNTMKTYETIKNGVNNVKKYGLIVTGTALFFIGIYNYANSPAMNIQDPNVKRILQIDEEKNRIYTRMSSCQSSLKKDILLSNATALVNEKNKLESSLPDSTRKQLTTLENAMDEYENTKDYWLLAMLAGGIGAFYQVNKRKEERDEQNWKAQHGQ